LRDETRASFAQLQAASAECVPLAHVVVFAVAILPSFFRIHPSSFLAASHSQKVDVLVADVADAPSLERLASKTKVLVSTVGPYALYGSNVVAACVHNSTDYCDITGPKPLPPS
jgi:hypothetical protein